MVSHVSILPSMPSFPKMVAQAGAPPVESRWCASVCEMDASGKVYVVWSDCVFEPGCTASDLVFSTSTNGNVWSKVTRIPLDPIGSGVDHFIPGLAVDRSASGSSAHLAVAFYFYPNANCTAATCQLKVGFSTSADGGASWTTNTQLAG